MRGKMLASFLRTANMMLGINSLLLFITVVHSVEVARPRGVPLSSRCLVALHGGWWSPVNARLLHVITRLFAKKT